MRKTTPPSNPPSKSSNGHQQQWDQDLVELYQSRRTALLAVARRVVCDDALAEDCVHDAFLAFHIKKPEVAPGREYPYLRSMVRNAAISLLRRESSREALSLKVSAPTAVDSAEREALALLAATDLARAVGQLASQQTAVVEMRLVGYSLSETAVALEVTNGTVKTHRHRAARSIEAKAHCVAA